MSDAEVATPRPKEDSEASTPRAAEMNTNGVSENNNSAADNELPKVSAPETAIIEKAIDSPVEETKEEADKKEIIIKDDAKDLESKGAGDCSANLKPVQNNESLEVKNATPETPVDIADNGAISDQSATPTPAINGSSTSPVEGKVTTPSMKERDPSELVILELKQALQKTADERDNFRKKFDSTKEQLATLQASYDAVMAGGNDDNVFKQMIEQLRCQLVQTSLLLDDKSRLNANQEKQINALGNQVASLKEVETLTRSLLQIRNMEVKHLQAEVDDMEKRINQERERYNTMINKMDSAVQLNADLKKEYETQLTLFKDLKEKYEEKVVLLTEEKRALEVGQLTEPNAE